MIKDGFRGSWRLWNKPHTIRISKKKIIIGLYIVWTLLPISNKQHIIYADPIAKIPAVVPAPLKPIPQTTLQPQTEAVSVPVAPVVTYTAPVHVISSGSCNDWLAQAGVSDVTDAMALIAGESGCNPNSYNSSSGACGVAQELPCGKSGCSLGDGACQVKWMNGYVLSVYGSWANAYGTWLSRYPHWY